MMFLQHFPTNPPPFAFASTSALIDWYGTVRGRVGYATGQWLFFGTGGLAAYGDVSLNSTFSGLALTNIIQTSSTRTGWVGGVGMEYLVLPNLSFSLNYQYVDLGTLNVFNSLTSPATGNTLNQIASNHAQFQTVMFGLSWHFAAVGGALPWTGGYVGGQGGGGWATAPMPSTLPRPRRSRARPFSNRLPTSVSSTTSPWSGGVTTGSASTASNISGATPPILV
jgi:hypothetical protein